jgi:hypothetical protein
MAKMVGVSDADRQAPQPLEFRNRRAGMIHAMDGGLWFHRHVWDGRPMAHLVSTDRELLLTFGRAFGLSPHRLQYKPLKDPRTAQRVDAWHWDLAGPFLDAVDAAVNRPAVPQPTETA